MSRSDSIKEEIGWMKLIFALSATFFVSLFAWFMRRIHLEKTDLPEIIAIGTLIYLILFSFLALYSMFKIRKKIRDLERE